MTNCIEADSKILVTGATGFTGSHLIRKLVDAKMDVSVIARQGQDSSPLKNLNVKWFRGNVFDSQVIAMAAKDVNYIFHVAAAYREAKLTKRDYYNVHVESTKLLAKAALKECGNFKRFIHISTVGVHGHIENPPANEETPFHPGDDYQKTKAEAELWLKDFARENNFPYTIIRPAAIFGPGDARLLKVFKMASKKIFPILGFGKCLYHLIHVDDLTDIIILVAHHDAAIGQAFIAGNTTPSSLTEMAKIISSELGKKPFILRIPAWPFFLLGDICELICKPLGIEPPIYRRRVAFFTKDRAFDTSKLVNLLDYKFKYDNESGLRQTTKWYLENNWLKR